MQSWKAAHDQFVQTLNAYTSECATLHSILSSTRPSFHEDYSHFETALMTIKDELEKFELHKQVLESSISSLKKARNLSYTLVPVNALPQSLLLDVFLHVINSEYAERMERPSEPRRTDKMNSTLVVSSVCVNWRHLILESPTVWSTIIFHQEDRAGQFAQLSLTRAGSTPINIQAILGYPMQDLYWPSVLKPIYNQIRSLDMVLPDMQSLRTALGIWPQDSSAPSLKTLFIKVCNTTYRSDTRPSRVLSRKFHKRFLENVTRFYLCGGYFDWDSAAFAGLEHLQVRWVIKPGPTLSQIVRMLRASPKLRTLGLEAVPISLEEAIGYQPVRLEHLEVLSLRIMRYADLCGLLPLLSPGSQLHSVYLENAPRNQVAIELFSELFRRSTITSLYLHYTFSQKEMTEWFANLPSLCNVYCANCDIAAVLDALSVSPPANCVQSSPGNPPCSQLSALHFYKCKFAVKHKRSWGPITKQRTLAIKLQDCNIPSSVKLPQSGLGPEEVVYEYSDSRSGSSLFFNGVNHTRAVGLLTNETSMGPEFRSLQILGD